MPIIFIEAILRVQRHGMTTGPQSLLRCDGKTNPSIMCAAIQLNGFSVYKLYLYINIVIRFRIFKYRVGTFIYLQRHPILFTILEPIFLQSIYCCVKFLYKIKLIYNQHLPLLDASWLYKRMDTHLLHNSPSVCQGWYNCGFQLLESTGGLIPHFLGCDELIVLWTNI